MQPWWWRSVAACTSVVAAAGLVAVVATASDGDRAQHDRTALAAAADARDAAEPATGPASRVAEVRPGPDPAGRPGTAPARVRDAATGASVAVPAGWRRVDDQRLVPVPPDRFATVLAAGDRAVVLVGPLDPARARTPATVPALAAEARRLVTAFADGVAAPGQRVVDLGDDDAGIAGRAASTALRRVDGGDRRTAGTLVRVSTVDAAPGARGGVVVLAVVRPGRTQAADARAADEAVRSLEPVRPRSAAPARPAAAPRPAAPPPAARPAPGSTGR